MTIALKQPQLKTSRYYLYYRKFEQSLLKKHQKRSKIRPTVTIYGGTFFEKCFTGKELDAETGLYYYGARYLDPRISRWLSVDPAMYEGDYLPSAPVSDEARKRNQNLLGEGGIFNITNMHVYHYAANNPIMYIDPNGEWVFTLGLSGRAGYWLGVHGSAGIAFGYSKKEGFSFGVYYNHGTSIGTPTAGVGITCSFILNADHVVDIDGSITSMGGSYSNFGVEIARDEHGRFDPASGVSVSIQTPGTEVHISSNNTTTFSTSLDEIVINLEHMKREFVRKIIEGVIDPYSYNLR